MITTNDEALYKDCLRLRSHGINKADDAYLHPEQASTDGVANPWYYEMRELGFNYRLSDVHCALGLSQLRKIDRFIARRRELARRYDGLLSEIPHVAPTQVAGRDLSAHHLYVVRIDFGSARTTRAKFMNALRDCGIYCQVHYIPVHYHPYYRANGKARARFPVTERYYEEALSLPLYYGLSDADQDYVLNQVKRLLA
jgi:dTDP-4-amino-4,6-dideoxygalactose transaminase